MAVLGFFKNFRIGLTLLISGFKVLLFKHARYFIFCLLLTVIQLSKFLLTGFINPKISLSTLISESLAGLNFFEILFMYLPSSKVSDILMQVLFGFLLLLTELFLILLMSGAACLYTNSIIEQKDFSIGSSFDYSLKKSKKWLYLALFDAIILFSCALVGVAGNILYFLWEACTAFTIPILIFEHISVSSAIKKSFLYLSKNISRIFEIDAILELILIILGILIYYIYEQFITAQVTFLNKFPWIILLVIMYGMAVVYLVQIITFTKLYRFYRHR